MRQRPSRRRLRGRVSANPEHLRSVENDLRLIFEAASRERGQKKGNFARGLDSPAEYYRSRLIWKKREMSSSCLTLVNLGGVISHKRIEYMS